MEFQSPIDISSYDNIGDRYFSEIAMEVCQLSPKKVEQALLVQRAMKADGISGAIGELIRDLGFLSPEEVKKVREMVELPMKHPEVFQKLGVGE